MSYLITLRLSALVGDTLAKALRRANINCAILGHEPPRPLQRRRIASFVQVKPCEPCVCFVNFVVFYHKGHKGFHKGHNE